MAEWAAGLTSNLSDDASVAIDTSAVVVARADLAPGLGTTPGAVAGAGPAANGPRVRRWDVYRAVLEVTLLDINSFFLFGGHLRRAWAPGRSAMVWPPGGVASVHDQEVTWDANRELGCSAA